MTYYRTMAATVDREPQSDLLYLLYSSSVGVVGYSDEFLGYTPDVREASDANTSHSARWTRTFNKEAESMRPASYDEVRNAGLLDVVIGVSKMMCPGSEIEPLV
jgi:hypothetical protein